MTKSNVVNSVEERKPIAHAMKFSHMSNHNKH